MKSYKSKFNRSNPMKSHIAVPLQVLLGLALFVLAGQASGTVMQQDLYNFGSTNYDGSEPIRVVQGTDGWLYGTTAYGGNDAAGTIFKVNTNGTGYAILHSFNTNDVTDGAYPTGDIVVSGGWLYGTTANGGTNNAGTAYTINTNGTGFVLLHSFTLHKSVSYGPTETPRNLMLGSDGFLYGIIEGTSGGFPGCVFKLNTNGGGYLEIYLFGVNPNGDFYAPVGGLVQGRDGILYGTAIEGYRAVLSGGVFKLNPDGTGYSILCAFGTGATAPSYPVTTLIQGQDGSLYGTTEYGGTNSIGTIFKVSTNSSGSYTELYSFTNSGYYTTSAGTQRAGSGQ